MALSKIPSDLLEGAVSFNSAAPADSLAIDASGNVGIGTSSPTAKLDVAGSVFSSGIFRATVDGTAAVPSIQPGPDNDTGIYRPATNVIGFSTLGTERMRIDSAGRVLKPNQPAFRAYSVSAAIGSDVSFGAKDSAFSGRDAGFSTSTGLYTAPVDGVYVFSFCFLHNSSTIAYARVLFRINGTVSVAYSDTLVTVYGSYTNTSASMAFALSANDTVGLYNEGVAIYGTSYGSFSGFLVG